MLNRILMSVLCAAALTAPAFAQGGEVNVYSYREHKLIAPLLDAFTKDTEIKVNVISASSGLEQRIKTEGTNTRHSSDTGMLSVANSMMELGQTSKTAPPASERVR